MAQHIAAEFVGRYRVETETPLQPIALTTDSSALTSHRQRLWFEEIFRGSSRLWVNPEMWSGHIHERKLSNVLRALESAKRMGNGYASLSGSTAEKCRRSRHLPCAYRSASTPRIQEAHTLIIHILERNRGKGIRGRCRVIWIQ